MTVKSCIKLDATKVEIVQHEEGWLQIVVRNGGEQPMVYEVSPGLSLDMDRRHATAILALRNVTPVDDQIPF